MISALRTDSLASTIMLRCPFAPSMHPVYGSNAFGRSFQVKISEMWTSDGLSKSLQEEDFRFREHCNIGLYVGTSASPVHQYSNSGIRNGGWTSDILPNCRACSTHRLNVKALKSQPSLTKNLSAATFLELHPLPLLLQEQRLPLEPTTL